MLAVKRFDPLAPRSWGCLVTGSMLALVAASLILVVAVVSAGAARATSVADASGKAGLAASIERRSDQYWQAAQQIWQWAEPGYQEEKSAALLIETLSEEGFQIERGVAEIPTAFVASFGTGKPVIGILAEYDALPGLSQKAVPEEAADPSRSYGHGCGHHLFGVGSVASAIALADAIRGGELKGTVRLYGTPAEEGGGAKAFMVRAGLFADVDAVLHWHPADSNVAGDPSNMARVAAKFRFHGRSAHAAAAPEQGRSALDAVELMNYAAELMREHTPEKTRIHHVITAGGEAPNVVPDFAEVYYYVRNPDAAVARSLYDRLVKCAQGAALATETELETEFLGGIHNILPNDTLAEVTLRNFRQINDLSYTPEERTFASKLQQTLAEPISLDSLGEVQDQSGGISPGSTDVGDVSWVVPTTGINAACWVPGTPAHSWQAVASGGTTIGQKGMMLAARVLAATGWDLMKNPELIADAKAELEKRLAGHRYEAMLEPGQPPPLDYRNPASSRK